MTLYTDDRPHPLGLTNNPEWDLALTKRAELYIAERARRANPEPTGTGLGGFVIAILAVVAVAVSAIAGLVG